MVCTQLETDVNCDYITRLANLFDVLIIDGISKKESEINNYRKCKENNSNCILIGLTDSSDLCQEFRNTLDSVVVFPCSLGRLWQVIKYSLSDLESRKMVLTHQNEIWNFPKEVPQKP